MDGNDGNPISSCSLLARDLSVFVVPRLQLHMDNGESEILLDVRG